MYLYKGISILIQTIASASVLMSLVKNNNPATLDNTLETRQLRNRRETRLRQARNRMALLKQIDANKLPLVATDRSAIEHALLGSGAAVDQSMSDLNTNESSSKKKIGRAKEIRIEPWALQTFAAEIPLRKETIIMNTRLLLYLNNLNVPALLAPRRMKIWGFIALVFTTIFLAGCNLPNPAETPVIPTATPIQNTSSISGYVWQDICDNLDQNGDTPSGCTKIQNLDVYLANGIREAGETGLANISVELGIGSCPANSVWFTKTDGDGKFTFQGLGAGMYCVRAVVHDGSGQPARIESGIWTYPVSADEPSRGTQTLTLQANEQRGNVNFGWYLFNEPAIPDPTPTPTSAPGCIDAAIFVKDVTIPDETYIDPGKSFIKVWRLRNSGTCTWTSQYALSFQSGYRMGAASTIPLGGEIEPGQAVDLRIDLQAPQIWGSYWGFWMLRNASGQLFGTGDNGNSPVWVKIITEPEILDWRGVYFNNQNLSGDAVLIRNDKSIDFNWKYDSPASTLSKDYFSARWTRSLKFDEAFYRFTIRVDDGVRLWIDDRLVIDEWEPNPLHTATVDLRMADGKHDIKLEYFERSGQARIHFDMERIRPDNQNYWVGKYWYNRSLDSSWALVKQVGKIDFDWGKMSPALGIPNDDFSARWSRLVNFTPGNYRLCARANDGVRVKVDNELVLNEWHSGDASQDYCVDITLSGSTRLDVEYYERSGTAKVAFWWKQLDSVNETPVAYPDAYATSRNETLFVPAPGVLINDRSAPEWELPCLRTILIDNATHGSLALNEDGSFEYTPDVDFVGEDTFTYRISDCERTSDPATVSITVVGTSSRLIAVNDSYELLEDNILTIDAPGVLANDRDPDGQMLHIILVEEPLFGTLTLNEDGSLEYIPVADFHGEDRFTYRLSDGELQSELALVEINVLPINDVPVTMEDRWSATLNQIVEIAILANDQGLGDGPLSVAIKESPTFGTVEIQNNMVLYTPEWGFTGEVSFTYIVVDNDGEQAQAHVLITIEMDTH